MNKTEIYKKLDTILNINNEVEHPKKQVEPKIIYPYKKGQKLYEKHFFEDIYKVNNINTHTGIIVLEKYEKYIKLIGDYLIDLTIKNTFIENDFSVYFFNNYLIYKYPLIKNKVEPKLIEFFDIDYYLCDDLHEIINIGYEVKCLKYILKYISGTEAALNGTIDITNFTVSKSQNNKNDYIIKYSSHKHYNDLYTK